MECSRYVFKYFDTQPSSSVGYRSIFLLYCNCYVLDVMERVEALSLNSDGQLSQVFTIALFLSEAMPFIYSKSFIVSLILLGTTRFESNRANDI